MSQAYRVFVSSTSEDLAPERAALERALHGLSAFGHAGMEYFGSAPESTRHESLRQVDRVDVLVLVVAGRYGSGITEAEYDRAWERELPCFVFFKADSALEAKWREADPGQRARLEAFKGKLRERHLVDRAFTEAGDLVQQAQRALHNWLYETQTPDRAPTAAERVLPECLPLLADRDVQDHELDAEVARELEAPSGLARVLILPGALNEEHDALIRRFTDLTLRAAVERTGEEYVKSVQLMDWPDPLQAPPDRLVRLRADLAEVLELPRDADGAALAGALDTSGRHWTFRYPVDARQWVRGDAELIAEWGRFWRALPPMRSGGLVFVFVCLLYPVPSARSLWSRLFGGVDRAMREIVRDSSSAPDSGCRCLPELQPLEQVHVERWADTRCPTHCPELDCDVLKEIATRQFDGADQLAYGDVKPALKRAVSEARRASARAL